MRKRFAIILAVVLLFNAMLFAVEAADYEDKAIIAAFSVKPEFTGDMITIRFEDIPGENGLKLSYNPDTGFICAANDSYRVFIKELDDNVEASREAVSINRIEEIDLYLEYRFEAYVYIYGQTTGLEGTGASLAEVTVDFREGSAYFTIRKIGTSISSIDNENVDTLLKNNMLLVNRSNTLGRAYFPADMVYGKPSRGRAAVAVRLDREAMRQLNYMLDAAYSEGVSGMVITSAFRNFDKQTSLYNEKTNALSRKMSRKTAMEEASKVVAIPGSSEHQTGLAADICSEGVGLISNFGNTKQGKWLKENSWKFGFVIRYPKEKTAKTGIIYEPWHIRYVGEVHSEIMKDKDMCLEEYVEYLKENKAISFVDSRGGSYAIQYVSKYDFNRDGLRLSLPQTSAWSISNCTKDSYILTIKL